MTTQNDVVWTPISIPAPADYGTVESFHSDREKPLEITDQAIKPETVPVTVETPLEEDSGDDARTRLAASQARLKHALIPPDIIREDRPSLLKVIARAWSGQWGPQKGLWRVAAKIDAVVLAIPGVALFYSLAWIWELPSRRICAGLLGASIIWLLITLGWL